MDAMQALVLTHHQLNELLREAARQGAALAVAELRSEIHQSPDDITLQRLRGFLQNPSHISNPHDCWAHSGIIRLIEPTPRGKPKSAAWFMKFQRETGLAGCHTRPSPAYGRRREWSFADIRLAWETFYHRR
ncbi:hypothetical protein KZ699_07515 [Agrobacterium cucumeris]|uniref:Transposase n=2 Tax=Agrobacterium cucumeris TaxID=2862866 RepID=A0ABY8RIJ7_9HYPH|nr:hypothetical protein KZ699_07515 [Agrobacterium cucumeris]